MKNIKERTIGQIVAADYRTAQIFHQFNIDFCCGGDKFITDSCTEKGIEADEVIEALENLANESGAEENYNNWSLDFLIDYIINNHHNKTREQLPEIKFYAKKVASVHGREHEELIEIYKEFIKLSDEMIDHMQAEEERLFPYIKKLTASRKDEVKNEIEHSSDMIALMQEEHDKAGDSLKKIRKLSRDFTLPDDACNTYKVFFKRLESFEKDMHKHVHLENNILFPKAMKLQQQ